MINKMTIHTCSGAWLRRISSAGIIAAFTLLLASTGCESILDVEPPDRVPDETLEDASTARLQVRSVIATFNCAYSQYIVTTGEVADVFLNSNLNSVQAFDFDARRVSASQINYAVFECAQYNAIYQPLSMMLSQAAAVLDRLQSWTDSEVPNRTELMAKLMAYAGYGRVLLGEAFCAAAINLSEILSSQEILAQAERKFTKAIELARQVGNDSILHMARVGRARVRRDLGKDAGALADAKKVPEEFIHYAHYSSASERSSNQVYDGNNGAWAVSVGPDFRNLAYEGVPDPRVPAQNTGNLGSGGAFEVWVQLKYDSRSAPIPLATWDEAQLIIAEIKGGQRAVEIINYFHQRARLPEFHSTNSEEIMAHVIQERARELFLEGQRFWDIRRFELPLEPSPGTPYPKGGVYGNMRCFPLPDVERNNNPNIPS